MLFQVTEYLSSVGAVYSNDAALGSDRDSEVRVSSISDSASVALFMKYVFEAPQSVCAPAVTGPAPLPLAHAAFFSVPAGLCARRPVVPLTLPRSTQT